MSNSTNSGNRHCTAQVTENLSTCGGGTQVRAGPPPAEPLGETEVRERAWKPRAVAAPGAPPSATVPWLCVPSCAPVTSQTLPPSSPEQHQPTFRSHLNIANRQSSLATRIASLRAVRVVTRGVGGGAWVQMRTTPQLSRGAVVPQARSLCEHTWSYTLMTCISTSF